MRPVVERVGVYILIRFCLYLIQSLNKTLEVGLMETVAVSTVGRGESVKFQTRQFNTMKRVGQVVEFTEPQLFLLFLPLFATTKHLEMRELREHGWEEEGYILKDKGS